MSPNASKKRLLKNADLISSFIAYLILSSILLSVPFCRSDHSINQKNAFFAEWHKMREYWHEFFYVGTNLPVLDDKTSRLIKFCAKYFELCDHKKLLRFSFRNSSFSVFCTFSPHRGSATSEALLLRKHHAG